MAFILWLLRRRPRRRLRHEWAAARHLRSDAALARAALSRDPAGVLSACQPHRHGRLLDGGPLDSLRNPLLPALAASHRARRPARSSHQSSPARRRFPQVRLHQLGGHWIAAVGAGSRRTNLRLLSNRPEPAILSELHLSTIDRVRRRPHRRME